MENLKLKNHSELVKQNLWLNKVVNMVSKGRGNFLKVKCLDCDNEQIIFDRAASDVKCIICGKTLVKSRGAKAKIMAHIDKVLN